MKPFLAVLVSTIAFYNTALAVTVGDTAPEFSLSTYGGGTFSLTGQKEKVTVIFFMGCT